MVNLELKDIRICGILKMNFPAIEEGMGAKEAFDKYGIM